MSLVTTVTLPEGTPAVVHTESLGRGEGMSRSELVATLLHNIAFEIENGISYCAALRAANTAKTKVSFRQEGPWELGEIRVLCIDERCRAEAEQYEKELGEEHPDAPAARAWAAAADEYTRDHAQELAAATILDANLARLSAGDPDAGRIFPPDCFTAEWITRIPGFDLAEAVKQYAAAKHAEGRMDRYYDLFAGSDLGDDDRFPPAADATKAAR